MIKFFRHIRRSLINQNNMGKYFKYAIGEILLVVIGILIALSINNWNESNKRTAQEIEILKEIKHELEDALEEYSNDVEDHERNLNSTKIIRNTMLYNKEYNDSLNAHFLYMIDDETLTLKQSAFESLKSIGLEIISNDSIRQDITTVYMYVKKNTNQESTPNKFAAKLFNFLEPHIAIDREVLISDSELINKKYWGRNVPFKLINYEALLNNETFLFNIMQSIDSKVAGIVASGRFKNLIEEVISDIDIELKRLE
jgi:hypothetical protein